MSISITLTVNGVVLAGRLIGYTRYYDGIIKLLHNVKVIADAMSGRVVGLGLILPELAIVGALWKKTNDIL